jgi:prepilin-type N-terminal cleavage/methylation domain-containing protein
VRGFKGFTLIELLIVIAMLSLIMVVVMPNIRNIRDQQSLNSAVAEFQSHIRLAQNNALSGVKCNSSTKGATEWHLTLTATNSYKIEASCIEGTSPTKTYTLSSGVAVEKVNNCATVIDTSIAFYNINGNPLFVLPAICAITNPAQLEFVLKFTANSSIATKKVIVDKGGRVYAQN